MVLELVENVFGVGTLTVELHDLKRVGLFDGQVGDVGAEVFLALFPEASLRAFVERLEFDLGELHEAFVGFALPVVPVDFGDGFFDVEGELEFEKVGGSLACALFVPSHDGFLAEADVAPVEADAVLGERASPDFFHRFDPAARAHAIAFAPFHVKAEARTANHAGERMMAGAAGFLRVVADGRILLAAVARDDGGVPVGHGVGWYGVMYHLLGGRELGFHLRGFEAPAESAEGVLAAEPPFVHAGDLGYCVIILKPTAVGEPCAADETVQREGFEDVGHGRGVGAGAWQRVACGKFGNDSAALKKVIPRHQSSIRGERLVAATQVKLTTCGKEFEIKCCFTQWVNRLFVRFRLQMPIG